MKGYRFEVFPRTTLDGRRYFFHMVAPNNEIILQSQPYKSKAAAIATVTLIQTHAERAQLLTFNNEGERT